MSSPPLVLVGLCGGSFAEMVFAVSVVMVTGVSFGAEVPVPFSEVLVAVLSLKAGTMFAVLLEVVVAVVSPGEEVA